MRKISKIIDGATGTASSSVFSIQGADRVTLFFEREDHTSGSSTFTPQVGIGTEFTDYNKWITNATGLTRASTLALTSTGPDFLTMSPEDSFEFIKVNATGTATGGTHGVWLVVDAD
jgi:hypothetical protein